MIWIVRTKRLKLMEKISILTRRMVMKKITKVKTLKKEVNSL
jgi:hypothetical protein